MVDTTAGQGDGTGSPGLPGSEWSRIPRWLHRVAHDQAMLAAPGGTSVRWEVWQWSWVVLTNPALLMSWSTVSVNSGRAPRGREKALESLVMLESHDVIRRSTAGLNRC